MPEQRIKGQEVEILVVEGGSPVSTVQNITNFEMTNILELLTEGYLNETTDRRDEIYRGFRGSFALHFSNRDVIDLIRRIVNRARRRTAGLIVNIKATLQFPNGQRVRVVLKDCFFGEVPMSFGSRSDYGTISMTFEGSDWSLI